MCGCVIWPVTFVSCYIPADAEERRKQDGREREEEDWPSSGSPLDAEKHSIGRQTASPLDAERHFSSIFYLYLLYFHFFLYSHFILLAYDWQSDGIQGGCRSDAARHPPWMPSATSHLYLISICYISTLSYFDLIPISYHFHLEILKVVKVF